MEQVSPTPSTLQFADLEPVGLGTPAGRYLRLFWHPVCRARDLKAKQAKPIEILSEKFTLYRGEDGVARVVGYRCPHRGAPLTVGWVEGNSIRCRYHGWRFDGDGRCTEQPNEERPFCDHVALMSHPTREYAGLIFAFLGDGQAPAFPSYPDLELPGTIVADPTEILPCGYWNRFDNDSGHIAWVHRATAQREGWSHYLVPRRERVEETDYGFRTTRLAGTGESQDALGMREFAHFFMPNAFQFWQRTRVKAYQDRGWWDTKVTWTVPINDHTYAGFDVTRTPIVGEEGKAFAEARYAQMESEGETRWDLAEKILAGEMTLEDLPRDLGAATCFTIEDYVTQVGQGPIAGRGKEHLGQSDVKPALLRRLWLREVSALISGRPIKRWQMPNEAFRPQLAAAE